MKKLSTLAIMALTSFVLVQSADASPPTQTQLSAPTTSEDYSARRTTCDGFIRCRCGTTAARRHGLPYVWNGHNMKKASTWGSGIFPQVSFQVGAIGVKPHHVLTVEGGSSCEHATVSDETGTYTRNVCNMRFFSPSGSNFASVEPRRSRTTHTASARSHRHFEAPTPSNLYSGPGSLNFQ